LKQQKRSRKRKKVEQEHHRQQVIVLPTFYEYIFLCKSVFRNFFNLSISPVAVFVCTFMWKQIFKKPLKEMLSQLFTGVNFSSILWASLRAKVFFATFLLLQTGFVIFWRKNIGPKAACKCWRNWLCTAISPTFNDQHLCTKVFFKALLCLQFGFIICWLKEIGYLWNFGEIE